MSMPPSPPPTCSRQSFAFNAENAEWAKTVIAKYPQGRQASAVDLAAVGAGQEQGGWVTTSAMIESVAKMLEMPFIPVLEVATFYTMCQSGTGPALIWCRSAPPTPCWLKGSTRWWHACKKLFIPMNATVSADGKFSWMESGMPGRLRELRRYSQIGSDFYEDIDGADHRKLIADLRAGKPVRSGPANSRHSFRAGRRLGADAL